MRINGGPGIQLGSGGYCCDEEFALCFSKREEIDLGLALLGCTAEGDNLSFFFLGGVRSVVVEVVIG